jgi:CheY-like chemotaxis protein
MNIGSTVLIVEDNATFRELLREVLEEHHYVVLEAPNGKVAVEIIKKKKVDLAIVDLEMPLMNGLEFTKCAREQHRTFPIIIVTAYAAFYTPAEILAADIDAFLQKPVSMEKLMKIVQQI